VSVKQDEQQYAIHRLQAGKQAWYYLVSFARNGATISKRFYDGRHGGQEGAYRAAVAWRDEQLRTVPALSVKDFCELRRSNNASGRPGVTFATPARQPEGIWQAKLRVKGSPTRCKSFSVKEYGYGRALELATAARAAMLAELGSVPYLHDPLAIQAAASSTCTDKDLL